MKTGKTTKLRIRAIILILAFVSVALLLRLGYWQFVKGSELQKGAIEQQTRDVKINSKRGTIYDRNLKALAVSATAETVTLNPGEIKSSDKSKTAEYKEQTAKYLSEILEMDYETVYKKVTAKTAYEELKKRIPSEQASKIKSLKAEGKLKGVYLSEDSKRYYPYNNFASHIIGFTGSDNQGLAGIELQYDKYLKGVPGRVIAAKNAAGSDMPYKYEKYYNSQDGLNVVLTIDEVIQHYVEQELENALAANDAKNGVAAIVMDVKTGEILAMATKPDYNLNEPFMVTDAADLEKINQYEEGSKEYNIELTNARNKMWRNKAVVDSYEPGSTFKIFTSAIALEENLVKLSDRFTCSGVRKVADRNIRCSNSSGHGVQTFAQALQNSCNPAFMEIGSRISTDTFFKYVKGFGFRDLTGIDLPGEANGIFFEKSKFGAVENATASFGQGFQVTPIQLITAVSAVANGGKLMKPHLVKELTDSDGNVVKKYDGEFVRQMISEETSRTLRTMLEQVVSVGGGKNAYVKGFRIAGKTGTSEKQPRSAGKKIASMVGFAPADSPRIAVLVMIDEPEAGQYYGGVIAAPVLGNIFDNVLTYMNVDRKLNEEEKMEEDINIPTVLDLTPEQARKKASDAGFTISIYGDGQKIIKQIPTSNARLKKGSNIIAYTSETEPEMVTVPDVYNLTVIQANTRITGQGLNMKIDGTGTGVDRTGAAFAAKQDPKAGTVVQKGSIVYVEFRHENLE